MGVELSDGPPNGTNTIGFDEQKVSVQIYGVLGGAQVNRCKMECAPAWIVERAIQEEIRGAWDGAYVEVAEATERRSANIIDSLLIQGEEGGRG